jgi:propanol-preferring alcohol dehydrogenase
MLPLFYVYSGQRKACDVPTVGDRLNILSTINRHVTDRLTMQAMMLNTLRGPLEWTDLPDRTPGPGELRIKVNASGVCRTDLHVVDGELPNPMVPIIPGHEIVGRIDAVGAGVERLRIGERVGVPWLGHTFGICLFCIGGHENFCDRPLFTGFTRDGGFATATIVDARYAFPLGEAGCDEALAHCSALA